MPTGNTDTIGILYKKMVDNWPSPFVARTEIEKFTGGAIKEKYQANLDSAGKGPEGRIRCGRKILYDTNLYVRWLAERSEEIPARK